METIQLYLDKLPRFFDNSLRPIAKFLVTLFPNVHPNYYTVLRLILVIPTVILLINDYFALALVIFLFGVILDLLDGPVARYKKQTSRNGAFLDPLADKVLFLSVLCVFYDKILLWAFFWSIFLVEFALLSEHIYKFFYFRTADTNIRKEKQKSSVWGKIKFWAEMIALGLFFIAEASETIYLANTILVIAVFLAIMSLVNHLKVYKS